MDLEKFMERIKYKGSRAPTLKTLHGVFKAFVMNVPYSNATITSGRKMICSMEGIYDVIVNKNQGGICTENNILLSYFLRQLGFNIKEGQGSTYFKGAFTCEFYHSTPIAVFDNGEKWCYDAGWKLFQPVKFELMKPQVQQRGVYRIRKEECTKWYFFERLRKTVLDKDGRVLKQGPYKGKWDEKTILRDMDLINSKDLKVWHHLYKFEPSHHELNEFSHMFDLWSDVNTSSIMQDNMFVHIFTDTGLIQISNGVFTRKIQVNPITDQIIEEFKIKDDEHAEQLLKEVFKQNLEYRISFYKRHKFD